MKRKFPILIFAAVMAITAAAFFSFTYDLGENLRSNGRDFRQFFDWTGLWESSSPGGEEKVTQLPPSPVAGAPEIIGGPSTRPAAILPSIEENADIYARTGIWQIPPVGLPEPSGFGANINRPFAQIASSPAYVTPPPMEVALAGHLHLPLVDADSYTLGPLINGGEGNDPPVLATDVLPTSAERHALVVGIDEYHSISDLQKARNDAIAVSEVLEANGFNVTTLLDADQREFSAAVSALASTLSEDDEAFFYFAGHGVEVDGRNYLLPADIPALTAGDEFLLDSTSISADRALSAIQGSGARVTVMVLDACRDNPFPSDGRRSLGQSRGLAAIEVPEGAFIIYSAGVGQSALDRLSDDDPDPNSVFTRVLLPLLDQPDLPIHEVARQIRRDVSALASSINHDQRPAYYDEMLGEFVVAAVSGVTTQISVASDEGLVQFFAEEAYQRGREFMYGLRGREVDLTEAVRWYRRAAEQSHAGAQNELGYMYMTGEGVQQDYTEAVRWLRLAAEQGHPLALNSLRELTPIPRPSD